MWYQTACSQKRGLITVAAVLAILPVPTTAQIVSDGSLNSATVGTVFPGANDTISIPAELGSTVCNTAETSCNVFHSFSEFNINNGQTAEFTGLDGIDPAAIHNVLARVTGLSQSNINGVLRTSSMPNANFFLMNPNGVVFGPGAKLDIAGSFVVTTANEIRLADDTAVFKAEAGVADDTLTIAAPAAFGFLNESPAAITIESTQDEVVELTAADGKALSVIGGDVEIRKGQLKAESGRLHVTSVGSAGEVSMDTEHQILDQSLDTFEELGDIHMLDGARVEVTGSGGQIDVRAENLRIESGALIHSSIARGDGLAPGGNINVDATHITIDGAGIRPDFIPIILKTGIQSDTIGFFGAGPGGDIQIRTDTLEINGYGGIATYSFNASPAGDIDISAQQILMSGKTTVAPVTLVEIETPQTSQFGIGSSSNPEILEFSMTSSIASFTDGAGAAGNIDIRDALNIDLSDSATIANVALRSGSGGNITLSADSIFVTQGSTVAETAILAATLSEAADAGDAGNIMIDAQNLMLMDGGLISTDTLGAGRGGDLTIMADNMILDGSASGDIFTGIFMNVLIGSTGVGGNLTIENSEGGPINSLVIRSALMSTATFGSGRGGNINIQSDELLIDGDGIFAMISTATVNDGDSGSIDITAGDLKIIGGGIVATTTFGNKDAGNIKIEADTVLIDGAGVQPLDDDSLLFTGIDAETVPLPGSDGEPDRVGNGNAGTITLDVASSLTIVNEGAIKSATETFGSGGIIDVNATNVKLANAGAISSISTHEGDAGRIDIHAKDSILLNKRSEISSAADLANGGEVQLTAGSVIRQSNSTISATANLTGGNIKFTAPDRVQVINSTITGQAGGNGGNINIDPQFVILQNSVINGLAGGQDVQVTIDPNAVFIRDGATQILTDAVSLPPELDLAGSLVSVPVLLLDVGARLKPGCAGQFAQDPSSFTVNPSVKLPIEPNGWLPSFNRPRTDSSLLYP